MQPKHVIRYAPEPVHSFPVSIPAAISALFYFEHRADVYGWYAEARRMRYNAAFFMIEDFYTANATALFRSVEDDVYGPWRCEMPRSQQQIRSPVPELLRHDLEHLQSTFIDEWLFFPADPLHRREVQQYVARGLPQHAFNVRTRRLGQFDDRYPVWTHESPGSNSEIIDFLQKNWRFYGKEPFLSVEFPVHGPDQRIDQFEIPAMKKRRS